MKKIIKSCFLLLSLLVLFSADSQSYAKTNNSNNYNQTTITAVYRITENGLAEVSIEEYIAHKVESIAYANINTNYIDYTDYTENTFQSVSITGDWHRYDETSHTLVRRSDLNRRVSSPLYNATGQLASHTVSYSTSQTATFNITLSGLKLNAVTGGISGTYSSSASVSSSYSLSVRPGHYGWFEFEPLMYRSAGTLKTFSWLSTLKSSENVVVHYPKRLNNRLDGFLIARESTVAPR